jgi:20S proteasome subunit beta 3
MQSVFEYNGGSVVAMKGKNCVAIASDMRLGMKFMTVSTEFSKIYNVSERCMLGLAGLATDAQTL